MNKKRKTSKSTKKPHTTTKPKKQAKKRTQSRYQESYYCTLTWRKKPVPEETIMNIAKDFHRFAYDLAFNTPNPDPYTFHAWRAKIGVPRGTYNVWYDKFPEFKMIVDEGKEMLGYIRERGMLKKELAERSTMFTMHNYSPDWIEFNKYHAELRTDDDKKGDITVNIKDFSEPDESRDQLTR
jgi:hypothetical protein